MLYTLNEKRNGTEPVPLFLFCYIIIIDSLFLLWHDEKREIHFAIGAQLRELWQMAEVVGTGMLHYHHGARLYHLALKDESGQVGKLWQVVGWVGKDEIKLLRARANKAEYIAFHLAQIFLAKFFFHLTNEVVLSGSLLHARDAGAPTRQ